MKKLDPLLDNLNFPDAPDFISEPPTVSFEELNLLHEKILRHWNKERYSKPDQDLLPEPFVLKD